MSKIKKILKSPLTYLIAAFLSAGGWTGIYLSSLPKERSGVLNENSNNILFYNKTYAFHSEGYAKYFVHREHKYDVVGYESAFNRSFLGKDTDLDGRVDELEFFSAGLGYQGRAFLLREPKWTEKKAGRTFFLRGPYKGIRKKEWEKKKELFGKADSVLKKMKEEFKERIQKI